MYSHENIDLTESNRLEFAIHLRVRAIRRRTRAIFRGNCQEVHAIAMQRSLGFADRKAISRATQRVRVRARARARLGVGLVIGG